VATILGESGGQARDSSLAHLAARAVGLQRREVEEGLSAREGRAHPLVVGVTPLVLGLPPDRSPEASREPGLRPGRDDGQWSGDVNESGAGQRATQLAHRPLVTGEQRVGVGARVEVREAKLEERDVGAGPRLHERAEGVDLSLGISLASEAGERPVQRSRGQEVGDPGQDRLVDGLVPEDDAGASDPVERRGLESNGHEAFPPDAKVMAERPCDARATAARRATRATADGAPTDERVGRVIAPRPRAASSRLGRRALRSEGPRACDSA
jgi:hypothetical protein